MHPGELRLPSVSPPRAPSDALPTVQGIVNLAENGPLDGGLTVFRGSVTHFNELFRTFDRLKPADGWPEEDWYMHKPEMLDWLKERGCYWEKICAPPGALILWDSVSTRSPSLSSHHLCPRALTSRLSSLLLSAPSTTARSRSPRRPASRPVRRARS